MEPFVEQAKEVPVDSLLWLQRRVQARAAERERDRLLEAVNAGQYEVNDEA